MAQLRWPHNALSTPIAADLFREGRLPMRNVRGTKFSIALFMSHSFSKAQTLGASSEPSSCSAARSCPPTGLLLLWPAAPLAHCSLDMRCFQITAILYRPPQSLLPLCATSFPFPNAIIKVHLRANWSSGSRLSVCALPRVTNFAQYKTSAR
jgi:hypothetical protein